jgi:hypothetical protein
MINDNDVVIYLILSYEAAINMIASFAINACFVEMFDCSATFRKRTKIRAFAATRKTRWSHRTITRLNENDIQVRRAMRVYLSESYTVAYELHVQSLKSKQSSILWIMNVFDQLLIAHHENEILMKSDRVFNNDDIVKNQDHCTKWKMKIMKNEKKKIWKRRNEMKENKNESN